MLCNICHTVLYIFNYFFSNLMQCFWQFFMYLLIKNWLPDFFFAKNELLHFDKILFSYEKFLKWFSYIIFVEQTNDIGICIDLEFWWLEIFFCRNNVRSKKNIGKYSIIFFLFVDYSWSLELVFPMSQRRFTVTDKKKELRK